MTLQASQLAYARGNRKLFADLSFEVKAGQALHVAGRNGSGKTSLLRVLCGLAQPLKGTVSWQGRSINQQRDYFHHSLTYIGHGVGLKDDLTAWENVQIGALLAGRACTRTQACDALAQFGLSERAHLPARVLSQGQRRRIVLARLALHAGADSLGRLLVLDEPFVALDQESVSLLANVLTRQLAHGATLVYTTHQPLTLKASAVHELVLGAPHADKHTTEAV
jgi:heme exporter protein A